MTSQFWAAPKCWPNETVVLVGNGVTATDVDYGLIGDKARVIGVNNGWELPSRCDVLFFADTRWWRWNQDRVPPEFEGRIVSVSKGHPQTQRFLRMRRDYSTQTDGVQQPRLARAPDALWGNDSGMLAINLAFHLGFSRMILVGYDMGYTAGRSHWFGDHPESSPERYYLDMFAPTYAPVVAEMARLGIEVIRATPSRLDFIPHMPLGEALALPPAHRRDAFT